MNRIVLSIAAASLLASVTAPVAATTPTPREQQIHQIFVQMDKNGDGYIDATEAKTNRSLETAFPRIARTGMLDQQQFVAWYKVYDMEPAEE